MATAGMTAMVAFGVNVQPLLTFGSISTVAVGFAAQSTMQNVVSALQIVSSLPACFNEYVPSACCVRCCVLCCDAGVWCPRGKL